tara:strand:- start:1483 stop:1698 length:216 start_codon:yes stop_codon:yes gene_type:complete
MLEEITQEEIAQHYAAMLDSVDVITAGKTEIMSDKEWAGIKSRNKEHLTLMLKKEFWTNEDFKAVKKYLKD